LSQTSFGSIVEIG